MDGDRGGSVRQVLCEQDISSEGVDEETEGPTTKLAVRDFRWICNVNNIYLLEM